jgi:hypothetical protein
MINLLPRLFAGLLIALVSCGLCSAQQPAIVSRESSPRWLRGNTHAHTINSDGDSKPEDVARWYAENGYDFLFITDHGYVTDVEKINLLEGIKGKLLVMRGEEVSSEFAGRPVHVNALNPKELIEAQGGASVSETLQKDVDAIKAAGGIAQINHPNFLWALTANDIASVKGANLIEILNMHPRTNNLGAWGQAPSTEEIWDQVLSKGVKIWGVACDDVHDLNEKWSGIHRKKAGGGQGWIMVRSSKLTVAEIMTALENGDFYASTGVTLEDYSFDQKQISVKVMPNNRFKFKYRIQFIGNGGKILEEKVAPSAAYLVKGSEGYVRVRITDSNGNQALTQPVFLAKR